MTGPNRRWRPSRQAGRRRTAGSAPWPGWSRLLSALLVIGPGLAPGYLLVRDMVARPGPLAHRAPPRPRARGAAGRAQRPRRRAGAHVSRGTSSQKVILVGILVRCGGGGGPARPRRQRRGQRGRPGRRVEPVRRGAARHGPVGPPRGLRSAAVGRSRCRAGRGGRAGRGDPGARARGGQPGRCGRLAARRQWAARSNGWDGCGPPRRPLEGRPEDGPVGGPGAAARGAVGGAGSAAPECHDERRDGFRGLRSASRHPGGRRAEPAHRWRHLERGRRHPGPGLARGPRRRAGRPRVGLCRVRPHPADGGAGDRCRRCHATDRPWPVQASWV